MTRMPRSIALAPSMRRHVQACPTCSIHAALDLHVVADCVMAALEQHAQ